MVTSSETSFLYKTLVRMAARDLGVDDPGHLTPEQRALADRAVAAVVETLDPAELDECFGEGLLAFLARQRDITIRAHAIIRDALGL
jgi:hypothetical protein